MNVTLLLCDAAEVNGGKLYVLGGGWSHVQARTPANIALAVLLAVPWSETNRPISVEARLVDLDGNPVQQNDEDVVSGGQLEVGRPPGLKPGTNLNAPLAFKFNALELEPGHYRWDFLVDNEPTANAPFVALEV